MAVAQITKVAVTQYMYYVICRYIKEDSLLRVLRY